MWNLKNYRSRAFYVYVLPPLRSVGACAATTHMWQQISAPNANEIDLVAQKGCCSPDVFPTQPLPDVLAPHVSAQEYGDALAQVNAAQQSECNKAACIFVPLGVVTFGLGCTCISCYILGVSVPACQRRSDVALQPWRDKGLSARLVPGDKHQASRVRVGLPIVTQPGQQQFQVVVPTGAGPGTQIMATAPSGQQVAVVVPEGASPGSVFAVAC